MKGLFDRLRHALLGRAEPKVTRLAGTSDGGGMRIYELPPFNLHTADLMRYDPQVRIGLGARNGLLMAAKIAVTGDDPRVTAWVQQQWDLLWHGAAHQLLRAKLYGFLPFEVVYRQATSGKFRGLIEVERLIDYPLRDTRLLVRGDKVIGFTYKPWDQGAPYSAERERTVGTAHPTQRDGEEELLAPRALVCTFDAQCTNPYGCALLARAYPAWFEKWMPGGAKRTLRLRMIKDAYIGEQV